MFVIPEYLLSLPRWSLLTEENESDELVLIWQGIDQDYNAVVIEKGFAVRYKVSFLTGKSWLVTCPEVPGIDQSAPVDRLRRGVIWCDGVETPVAPVGPFIVYTKTPVRSERCF